MAKEIQIEIPEEISRILERDEMLKKYFEKIAVDVFKEKLLKYLIAEEITKNVKVSEADVLEMDEELKEMALKELESKWKQ